LKWESSGSIPASLLGKLCIILQNQELLEIVYAQAGRPRIFYDEKMKSSSIRGLDSISAIQRLMNEVSVALRKLSNTLADGVVTRKELKDTNGQLTKVIKECANLQLWLTEKRVGDQRDTHEFPNERRKRNKFEKKK
jgi:hypothetical protein